jgi:hypothetical protein
MRLIYFIAQVHANGECDANINYSGQVHTRGFSKRIYILTRTAPSVFAFSLWQRAKNEIPESTL